MKVWMYYETDGDAGYYGIMLFSTKEKAQAYYDKHNKGYGIITEIEVH